MGSTMSRMYTTEEVRMRALLAGGGGVVLGVFAGALGMLALIAWGGEQ